MAKQEPKVKMCLRCRKVKPFEEFFKNRAWEEEHGVDIYCRECAREMCTDKTALRKYCWENNRLWREDMWNAARKRGLRILAKNPEWLSTRTSKKRKDEIENSVVCNQFFYVMNLACYYSLIDNTDDDGMVREFDPDSQDGMLVPTEDGEIKEDDGARVYSSTWNGMFTKREIEYLDRYYARLEDDFVLDDVSIQDYARKICKASLEADNRYNAMRMGKCTSKEWNEAQNMFDSLSKSASFAACQKKDKSVGESQVLAEIIRDIEINHHARMPKVEFPKDVIDRILEDFAHTDAAIK